MYMKTPMMFGRPMKKVKEYPHFVEFIDEKTGIRECFQYWDLTHEIIDREVFVYNEKGDLVRIDDKRLTKPYRHKTNVMNDTRLNKLINGLFDDLI